MSTAGPGRIGPVRLADRLFCVALDDRTGRLLLSPRVLGLGLAAALLAELIAQRRITVHSDQLHVIDHRPPTDALTHTVLDQLAAEPARHPVRTWLLFLAQHSREQVADRMWRAGFILRQESRRLWHRETLYPPVDPNAVAMPCAMLVHLLRSGAPMAWDEQMLAALTVGCGLDQHVLFTADQPARNYLRHAVEHLPPVEHELVWHLHAAVGDAVLTGRT